MKILKHLSQWWGFYLAFGLIYYLICWDLPSMTGELSHYFIAHYVLATIVGIWANILTSQIL